MRTAALARRSAADQDRAAGRIAAAEHKAAAERIAGRSIGACTAARIGAAGQVVEAEVEPAVQSETAAVAAHIAIDTAAADQLQAGVGLGAEPAAGHIGVDSAAAERAPRNRFEAALVHPGALEYRMAGSGTETVWRLGRRSCRDMAAAH